MDAQPMVQCRASFREGAGIWRPVLLSGQPIACNEGLMDLLIAAMQVKYPHIMYEKY